VQAICLFHILSHRLKIVYVPNQEAARDYKSTARVLVSAEFIHNFRLIYQHSSQTMKKNDLNPLLVAMDSILEHCPGNYGILVST
jgi:hypothetical protein